MNQTKKVNVYEVALAALLHDMGKFAQRAGEGVSASWSELQGEFKYQHALHTWNFVNKYVPERFRAGALAAHHHRPTTHEEWLIRIADQLSAGERALDEPRDDQDRKAHPRQLLTIFSTLVAEGKKAPQPAYLPLKPLRLEQDVIFPASPEKDDSLVWKAYEKMWQDFCQEASALKQAYDQQGELVDYLEAVQALLQRYTWCIPSAYFNAIPDVSLYDHSRMTSALAGILAESEFSAEQWEQLKFNLEKADFPLALLVGGDISGVQDFIYTISSKRAAKTLRGRSFYLQLLTEAVLRFVLRRLELTYANVIYTGGGHFYLLAPLCAAAQLPDLRRDISQVLLDHHESSLYLALGAAQVPASGFRIGAFPLYWEQMHRDLGLAKQRRYTELGDGMYGRIFAVPEYGGNPDHVCSVCGEENRPVTRLDEEREEQARICSLCNSFDALIGRHLPEARFLALGLGEPAGSRRETCADALQAFGLSFQLLKSGNEEISLPGAERVVMWALDDPDRRGWPQVAGLPQVNLLRYTVNQVPQLTFDDLQKKVEGGFERLGVLRLDVDNLGDLFTHGFGDRATLARLSTFSFQVSLYFEGWVKRICEQWREHVYAVYAGGDDVFLIGPWDIIPDVARQIYRDFKRYAVQHPGLHLSGGMAFIGGKYPIYQAASDAGEAEKAAKSLPGKDAFAFLGQAWKWADFEALAQRYERLVRLVTPSGSKRDGLGGPQRILQELRRLSAQEARAADQRGRPVWGPWIWLSAYQLTRMAERTPKESALRAEIEKIRGELEAELHDFRHWGAAARWAQLMTRSKPDE